MQYLSRYQTSTLQTTIAEPVVVAGRAVFISGEARIVLRPSAPNTGIIFQFLDEAIPARIENLVPSPIRTTSLGILGGPQVCTVEHLLSAVYGLGICNLLIEVQHEGHVPFFDGSAEQFCNAILRVGVAPQAGYFKTAVYCQNSFSVSGPGGAVVRVDPLRRLGNATEEFSSNGPLVRDTSPATHRDLESGMPRPYLTLEVSIEFPEPIGIQKFNFSHTPQNYCLEVARARTFATKNTEDLTKMAKELPGLYYHERYGGSFVEAPILLFNEGKYLTTVRYENEPARHKALDLIGDLALFGYELRASVQAHRPGHRLNWELVKSLVSYLDAASTVPLAAPSATSCELQEDKSSFVEDVTIPDGTIVPRGARIRKIWRIRNSGAQIWQGRYLQRQGPCAGALLVGSEARVLLPTVHPGAEVDISVELLAPTLPGSYIAYWKIVDASGKLFFPHLHGLFTRIVVEC